MTHDTSTLNREWPSIRVIEMLTDAASTPKAIAAARRVHALIDGLALHLLHQQPDEDCAWAIDLMWNELDHIGAP